MRATALLLVFALAACANDQYNAPHGQDKMSSDLYACKMYVVDEYDNGRPALQYVPLVGNVGQVSGAMASDTPDGAMTIYDMDAAITKCMHKKGYKGESK